MDPVQISSSGPKSSNNTIHSYCNYGTYIQFIHTVPTVQYNTTIHTYHNYRTYMKSTGKLWWEISSVTGHRTPDAGHHHEEQLYPPVSIYIGCYVPDNLELIIMGYRGTGYTKRQKNNLSDKDNRYIAFDHHNEIRHPK